MIVQTDKGRLEGTTREGITAFKGVPYAAPPVGGLRWKPPQPVSGWQGVRPAQRFGKACIQPARASLDGAEPVGEQSEDCLYLNIWTSGVASARPVMVWLHGGGFAGGDGASSMYDGAALARGGAVVVTLNYRVGALGFFAHPALEREYPAGPVNFGLLDQIAALAWVQRNIADFGGDPHNVTIFGQGAGASSVLALYASPMTTGLFHKGIAQSPCALAEHTRDKAVAIGFHLAHRGWGLGPYATLAQLTAMPAAMFARTQVVRSAGSTTAPARMPTLAPVAIVGDDMLPRPVRDVFEHGEEQALPLILGSNSDESSVLTALGLDAAELLALIAEQAGPDTVEDLLGLYHEDPELGVPEELHDVARFGALVARDLLFTMQARWLATHHSQLAPTRRYYFSYVAEQARAQQPRGAAHGDEIVFAFQSGDVALVTGGTFTERDRAMARHMSQYWLSFARTGVPTGPIEWPLHQRNGLLVSDRVLKLGETIEVQANFRRTRLEILASGYPELAVALAAL